MVAPIWLWIGAQILATGYKDSMYSGDDCICFHVYLGEYHVISPFVIVGKSELRNITLPGFVEVKSGGSY